MDCLLKTCYVLIGLLLLVFSAYLLDKTSKQTTIEFFDSYCFFSIVESLGQAYPDQLRDQQYQNLRDIYISRRLPVLSSSRLKEPHAAFCTLGKTCACSCCTQTNL